MFDFHIGIYILRYGEILELLFSNSVGILL